MDTRIQFRISSALKQRAEDVLPEGQTLSGFLRSCLEDLVDGQTSTRQSSSQVSAQGPALTRDEAYRLVSLIQAAFKEDIKLLERIAHQVDHLHVAAFAGRGPP